MPFYNLGYVQNKGAPALFHFVLSFFQLLQLIKKKFFLINYTVIHQTTFYVLLMKHDQ